MSNMSRITRISFGQFDVAFFVLVAFNILGICFYFFQKMRVKHKFSRHVYFKSLFVMFISNYVEPSPAYGFLMISLFSDYLDAMKVFVFATLGQTTAF